LEIGFWRGLEWYDEETVKNDLSCVKIPGAIYWRGVFIKDFSKDQLIKIIYLLMENK